MKELAEIIRGLCPVSDEAMDLLVSRARIKLVPKRKPLITEGNVDSNFYLIRNGLMRFYHVDEAEDKEDTICFAVTGDAVVSLHSYYAGLPAMCTIEALVDTQLYVFSKEEMEEIFRKSNDLANWGRMVAFEEIFALERRYTYVGTGDAYSRYKSFIEMRSMEVFRQIPLKYIASYLGVTPQTFSKMRRRFAKE